MSLLPEGRITEPALAEYRSRVGRNLRISWQYNELASKEAIRNFARGIGDGNPLWNDEEYSARTRFGRLVAPPAWLYSVFPTFVQHGLSGVHAFHSGNDWEFCRPVLVNDRIKPECKFTGFEEKPSKFAGRTIIEFQEARYLNQAGSLVAKAKSWLIRAERGATREKGKYTKIQLPHPWTPEELRKIEDEVLAESPRGGDVRFWEDVSVSEELPALVKGPLGLTDEIAFISGSGAAPLFAHSTALRLYKEHPTWRFRDPHTWALEPIAGVHWNYEAASSAGLPYPYDVGIQRNSWLIQMLTNWIGDEGWIKRAYAEYRRFVFFSDVIWIKGVVERKYKDENGECCLDIRLSSPNQRGEDVMPGNATVILPSRETGEWPLTRRLG